VAFIMRIADFLRHPFATSREPDMEHRLFQVICLAACVFTLFIVIPVNIIEGLPWLLNATLFVFAVLSLAFYAASIKGLHLMKTFTALVAPVLDLCWFTDGGSQGSIGMFFFIGGMISSFLMRGVKRWLFLGGFILNVLLLLTLDYLHPEWSIPFNSPRDRYLDLLTGFLVCISGCILIIWVVVSSYDEEQKKLSDMNQELQRSLAEIKRLQGLLPICGWCKKVRNDEGLWTQVEHYLAERTELSFTHGLCPTCAEEHFLEAGQKTLKSS
jgi:hypothetical protein